MRTLARGAFGRVAAIRAAPAALALVLIAAGGCGRRGPPLAPLQVDPETPRVLPLRQENGAVVVRWYAPRLDSGGDPADLRLRKAIVSYRLLDLHALAAEERASQRQPPEEVDEDEVEAPPPADEAADGSLEPESPGTGGEPAAEAAAPEPVATAPGEEAPPPGAEPPGTAEPETEGQPPEGEPGEAPEPEQPPEPREEQPPAGGAPPAEADPEPEAEGEPEPESPESGAEPGPGEPAAGEAGGETPPEPPEPQAGQGPEPPQTGEEPGPGEPAAEEAGGETPAGIPEAEPEPESQATGEEPGPGEPAGEETGGETPAETLEPEAEPEPTGTLLDYEDLEFELLSEIDSEEPGEERVLELPVEPDWIGRRLEITVRYEARGGASEESEPQSLDVTGPLPLVEGVVVEVGPRELTISWQDPRDALGETPLAAPVFEVFRRRGEESERLGRSFGTSQADADVLWGEEVCYRARLVVAGSAEESVIPDPGPTAPDAGEPGGAGEATTPDESVEGAATPDESIEEATIPEEAGEETPAPVDMAEGGAPGTPAPESPAPQEDAAPLPEEPLADDASWSPIPIRVPGTGAGAVSVGPMSAEECVTAVDVFPPVPPSDLRLFWRSEQTELSWRESASTDVAGYHVYRSGPDGDGFQRLTESPVERTSYTDAARDPRAAYRYAITAVDGADTPNESLPSDPRTANPR